MRIDSQHMDKGHPKDSDLHNVDTHRPLPHGIYQDVGHAPDLDTINRVALKEAQEPTIVRPYHFLHTFKEDHLEISLVVHL